LPHTLGPRGEETINLSDDHIGKVFDSNLSPSQQAVLESDRTARYEDDGLPQLPRRSSRMATKNRGRRVGVVKREVGEGEEEEGEDLEAASLMSSRSAMVSASSNDEGGRGDFWQGGGGGGMGGGGATAHPTHPPPPSTSPCNTPVSWLSWLSDAEMRGGKVPVVTYDMAWTMFENEAEVEAKRGEEGWAAQREEREGEGEGYF